MDEEIIEIDEDGKVHAGEEFARELERLINRFSQENRSNTPDFILAMFIGGCLNAFNSATRRRDAWYGVKLVPAGSHFLNQPTEKARDARP